MARKGPVLYMKRKLQWENYNNSKQYIQHKKSCRYEERKKSRLREITEPQNFKKSKDQESLHLLTDADSIPIFFFFFYGVHFYVLLRGSKKLFVEGEFFIFFIFFGGGRSNIFF